MPVHPNLPQEPEPIAQTRRLILQDTRTKRYFGGGRADKLFSLWVANIEEAKLYRNMEELTATLTQLQRRNDECGVTNILSNLIIGPTIPPYSDDAYVVQEVQVHPAAPTTLPETGTE